MTFARTWTPPPRARDLPPPAEPPKLTVTPNYCGKTGAAVPKENRLECEEYRAIVRTLPCMHCGIFGYTQFCHGDQGKGMGIKTDDRTGWPGCGPHDHRPGCHYLIGTSGTFSKAIRRELEADYARRTRAEIFALGLWPKNLPVWEAA